MTVALSLLVFATGCPRNIPEPDDALRDAPEVRAAVEARIEPAQSARFKEVVLDYFGNGDRVKVRQLLLVKKPSYVRVQTRLPGSDEILNLLVTDGQTFAMHKRDTNEYFTGKATRGNIARLLPVDLTPQDVLRVMLGGGPLDRFDTEGSGEPTMEWDGREGAYRYEVDTRDGGDLAMWVRHGDFGVTKVRQRNADDEVVWSYETDDWRRVEATVLPDYRRFVWPARDLDFSMDVGETQLNVDLPEILFELPPPAGSREIVVDD
jgi:hypothetical protein